DSLGRCPVSRRPRTNTASAGSATSATNRVRAASSTPMNAAAHAITTGRVSNVGVDTAGNEVPSISCQELVTPVHTSPKSLNNGTPMWNTTKHRYTASAATATSNVTRNGHRLQIAATTNASTAAPMAYRKNTCDANNVLNGATATTASAVNANRSMWARNPK